MASQAQAFAKWLRPGWPFWLAVVITFSGTSIANLDVRGVSTRTLVISLPRMSPALAALEDMAKTWSFEAPKAKLPAAEVKLMSGKSAADIVTSVRIPQVPEFPWLASYLSRIPMGGRIAVKLEKAEPIRLVGMVVRQPKVEPAEEKVERPLVALNVRDDSYYSGRTEVSRGEQEQIVRDLKARDWQQPNLSQVAERLIKKENVNVNPTAKQLGGILVASPVSPAPQPASSPVPALPALPGVTRRPDPVASLSWAGPDTGAARRAILSGAIQLSGGLAITDPRQQLVVFRQMEGLNLEKARVWLDEGRFEVAVNSLRGRLLAQLQDGRGRILGAGELRLSQVGLSDASDRVENLLLKVAPVVAGAKVEVLSVHSYDRFEQTVPGAKVWLLGAESTLRADHDSRYFTEGGLHTGSSFIAQATAENHWGTIVVGLAGEETHARLFPNKMMDALLNLTLGENHSLAEGSGVVWGRVVQNGVAVSGATVEMAGDHRNQAHYFNSMLLPDRFAEATGENGTFAFVWVTPGIQSVRVIYKGQSYPVQVIPVERGNVSYLEFEIGHLDAVPFVLADPLDAGKELSAMVRWAGDETSEVDVQGHGNLKVPTGAGLMTVEVDAGELYELTRHTIARNVRRIHLDTVRRDWLMTLVSRKKVNLDSSVGIVVGYKMPDNFTVRLDTRNESSSTPDIVYFDSKGQALFSDEGVAGGGFVIFNVPIGLQTVAISTGSSAAITTEVVVATPEAVNVISSED